LPRISTHETMQSNRYSYIEGWVAIAANTLLFILKYWAGMVSGSIAIIADAWHTLSDSISSVFVLVGTKVSEKPPDERHPFGHGRAELVTAILIGMFLIFISYEFIRDSITKLLSTQGANYGTLAIVATVVSIVVKEGLAQFAFWTARRSNSPSLRADGWHHRTDALSSIIILIGILLGQVFWWVDGVLGILVALLLLYAAIEIIRDAVDPLMGKKPEAGLLDDIHSLCKKIAGETIHTHHFHLHEYGTHTELTFHLVFPEHYTLKKAHDLADDIEKQIREQFNIEATIHMEPKGDEQDFRPEHRKTL